MRINKFLSSQGICSRREADAWLANGRLQINSEPASLGQQLELGDLVEILDGEKISHTLVYTEESAQTKIYLAFNKPAGVVCTSKQENSSDQNIIDYINYPERIYPVGRLDKESRGLIFLTNDGDFTFRMTHPKFQHEKEYLVTTSKSIDQDFIDALKVGVKIRSGDENSELVKTSRCEAEKISDKQFRIVLTEGMNRQIRKMCQALGNRVQDLYRVRIGDYQLRDLAEGDYKLLKSSPCSFE